MATSEDQIFIRQVNQIALSSAQQGFDPFGALLVKDNKIMGSSIDKCVVYADPTAHAELTLLSEYCRAHKLISLEGYTLYCNVEPCVMCSGAIHWSRVSRLVYGIPQAMLQKVSKGKLKPACADLINTGNHRIEIVGPVLAEESMKVLKAYPFKSKKVRFEEYKRRRI